MTLLPALTMAVALPVALAIDRWWGEPPARLHPVVWMGHALSVAGRYVQRRANQQTGRADYQAFWLGAVAWCAMAAVVWVVTDKLQSQLLELPWWCAGLLLGLLLKPLLAWAMLRSEVQAVEDALGQSLDAGRARLAWLVSRDVNELTDTQVRESAIESLAENLNDSVVAPIFWFLLLGLPGAALYRFANTADAMWGYRGIYRGQNWEWAGKWAARADDVLSFIPARMTAVLLLMVAGRKGHALKGRLPAEAQQTPSPNSGWPMAAMALNLDVALRKPGVYVLNASGRSAAATDTAAALGYASQALLAHVVLAQAVLVLMVIGDML